jgi:hypothetical protein
MAHQNFTGKSTSFNYIKNFNFASSIGTGSDWTTQGIVTIDNGTSGVYGFASCPYIKIAVNQAYTGYAAGLLTQSVNLFASSYVLSFWAAVRPGGAVYYNTAHQVSVLIDSTTYFTSSFTTSNTTWTQYFVYFSVASAGSHTISFNFTTAGSNDSSIGITQVLVNNSFANYNFALPAQAANSFTYYGVNGVNNWNNTASINFVVSASTSVFGYFTTCPYGQYLIAQCGDTTTGYISQTLYLSATTYTLSFWAAVRSGGLYNPAQQVSVLVDDTTCYTSSFTTSNTAWTQYTFDFTVQVTGLHTIYIKFFTSIIGTPTDTSIGITQISVYYNNNTYGSIFNSFIPAPSSSGNFTNTLTNYSGKMLIFPTITDGNPSTTILTGIYTTITGITGTQSFMNGTYIANDSGNYGSGWTAFNLFNSSTETGFHSPSATYSATDGTYTGSKSQTISGTVVFGEWMTIQFPYRFVLTSYTTTVRFGYDAVRAPSTWKVGGSNDGTTWTLLDTRTNITTGVNTFSVSTTTQYSYYVIVISKITGLDGFLNFAEWTLYGTKTIDVTIPSILSYQLTNSALDKLRGLYAFRQCIFTYTGPVVNVRRASDSATSDFYADLSGNIGQGAGGTGTTLLSWLTSTTGYVTKWYDQSSQANHLVQATTANQPQIILNDWGGICLYLNTAISGSQLQTINNIFSTSTVTDAHVFFNAKALSYITNITFSLNSPVSYGANRFGGHLPWSDGIYYFDTGDNFARSFSFSNIVVPGTKSYFSGYKQSSTTSQGFNINNYTYSTASNPSATVSYLGLNFSDGTSTFKTNHYMYAFTVFSKSLYNSADERFLMNYFKVYVPAQYAALYAIYSNKPPWGIYDADKWNSSTNVLPDIRGWSRDATSGGTITKGSGAGNGATSAVAYITGSTASSLTWPSGSIPTNFTICSVTRYTGGTSRRILNGTSNWLHGHWSGNRGVCYYEGWKTNSTGVGTLNNWLVCCGKNSGSTPNNILLDSVASGTATGGASNQQLFINAGGGNYGETTDFQLSYLIIWDQILTDAEMLTTSNALLYYLSSGIPFEIPLVYDGLTAATAAPSAAFLTTTSTTNASNGVYWINLPTVGPTQVYCILDYAVDGGGWMMAMKATRGTTFPYSSSYWTTNNTLNPSNANRNDGDAKFNTMNYWPAKDMLALWPDITTVGGTLSLSSYSCWCWSKNGVVGSQPLINYFSTASNVVFDSNPRAGKERGSVFSSQAGNQFYGVNYTQRGGDEVRWGFAWNNETDWGSNDVRGGIGLASNAYSAGDNIGCCQDQYGINRTARVEVYVR